MFAPGDAVGVAAFTEPFAAVGAGNGSTGAREAIHRMSLV